MLRLADLAGDNKNMKTKQDVIETRRESIIAVIGGNKDHGWGLQDSKAVISDLFCEYAPYFVKGTPEYAELNAAEIREAVMSAIEKPINPSACRQWLEANDQLNKVEGGKRGNKLFAEF
jgi:hypothetical protein